LVFSFFLSFPVFSKSEELGPGWESEVGRCFISASQRYNVSLWLLWAIAKVESNFNYKALNKNKDGSFDVGLMQINSRWFPVLKDYGILPRHLWDPCTNVMVGAWILSLCIQKYGYTWDAVGCYHSQTPKRQKKYAYKVMKVIYDSTKSSAKTRGEL